MAQAGRDRVSAADLVRELATAREQLDGAHVQAARADAQLAAATQRGDDLTGRIQRAEQGRERAEQDRRAAEKAAVRLEVQLEQAWPSWPSCATNGSSATPAPARHRWSPQRGPGPVRGHRGASALRVHEHPGPRPLHRTTEPGVSCCSPSSYGARRAPDNAGLNGPNDGGAQAPQYRAERGYGRPRRHQ